MNSIYAVNGKSSVAGVSQIQAEEKMSGKIDSHIAVHGSEGMVTASFRQAYHEVGVQHVVEFDVLEQLKSNMSQLEDLHHRMKFMMGELSYLLQKK